MYTIRSDDSTKSKRLVVLVVLGVFVLAAIAGLYWHFVMRSQDAPSTVSAPETVQQEQAAPPVQYSDNLQRRAGEELQDYLQWLDQNDVKGYIGEFGWPEGADHAQWSGVAEAWLSTIRSTDIWTTAWAAGSRWSANYPLRVYTAVAGTDGLSIAGPQAAQLEAFWGADNRQGLHGVNVAGMEFGTNVSAKNRGVAGQDYFYEPAESYTYLAQHGVKLVRIPVRWERVQHTLFGPLDAAEMSAITAALDAAQANGIQVVLDLHNYGVYADGKTQLKLGSNGLSADALSNFWGAMTQQVGNHAAVVGYSIMNEPHGLWPGTKPVDAAKKWETLTQQVVTSLRGVGFDGTICVPGYDWSSLARWTDNHAKAWITDPQNNIRYEAHHYWDSDGSGKYAQPYSDELAGT